MDSDITALSIAAAGIAFVHTLMGPDHYLPFVGMARAGKWSTLKTTWVTAACGVGHVASSMLIGLAGIALGLSLSSLVPLESLRGSLAAWGLITFGLLYFSWGLRQAWRNRPHQHWHQHDNQGVHCHSHVHQRDHLHTHPASGHKNLTTWALFTVFLFGPCEPLIPLLMYPAATNSLGAVIVVTAIFGVVTVVTMLAAVLLGCAGVARVSFSGGSRYGHALAGSMILLCGLMVEFAGM